MNWMAEHGDTLRAIIVSMVEDKAFLVLAAVMYALYCAGIWKIGLDSHTVKATQHGRPEVYPKEYFWMLAIQLVPLTITGAARQDVFIFATRGITLLCVLIVYQMVANESGVFEWKAYRGRICFILSVLFLAPMLWVEYPPLRAAVTAYPTALGWLSVGIMGLFVIYGQGVTLLTIWNRSWSGHYQVRGFGLQIVRFAGFALQAVHYGLAFGVTDPIFVQSTLGALGAASIICAYLFGLAMRALARLTIGASQGSVGQ